jgi:peptidoglycan hydrolase CwlO-like protein
MKLINIKLLISVITLSTCINVYSDPALDKKISALEQTFAKLKTDVDKATEKLDVMFNQPSMGLADRIIAGDTWAVHANYQINLSKVIPLLINSLKELSKLSDQADEINKKLDHMKPK